MSAALATSSVIAVDGVSGEMAIPALIFRLWIFPMMGKGLSGTVDLSSMFGAARIAHW